MNKKWLVFPIALSLLTASPVFAASNNVLGKLQSIQQNQQNLDNPDSTILLPDIQNVTDGIVLPTIDEIKAELGSSPQNQLPALQNAVKADASSANLLKLAVAEQMNGSYQEAVAPLLNSISLAPDQQELYQALLSSYEMTQPGQISVFVDGTSIQFKTAPAIYNNRTLVPIRQITEQLGAIVAWDSSSHTATIRLLGTTVQLVQDQTTAVVNGKEVTLDAPAKNLNGSIVVPLRFVSESFNKKVGFLQGSRGTAIIQINTQQS